MQVSITYTGKSINISGKEYTIKDINTIFILLQTGTLHDIFEDKIMFQRVEIPTVSDTVMNLWNSKKVKRKDTISPQKRIALWTKYQGTNFEGPCYTCGKIVNSMQWHASHVRAEARGGTTEIDNLRVCCQKCNLSTGVKNLYVYMIDKKLNGPGKANIEAYFKKHPEQSSETFMTKDDIHQLTVVQLRQLLSGIQGVEKMNKAELVDVYYSHKPTHQIVSKGEYIVKEDSHLKLLLIIGFIFLIYNYVVLYVHWNV